jgi:hypothetical protein
VTHWYDHRPTFSELDETIVVGRPAFVASLYGHEGLKDHAQAVFDAWLAMVPPATALYYSHDNTKRIMKLTPKAIAKIRSELSVSSIKKMYKWYFVKSAAQGGAWDECHAFSFEIYVTPSSSSFVYVTFPLDHVEVQGAAEVVRWFYQWNERFRFTHGGAGYGYELAWFDEQAQCAGPTMLNIGLRYHGVRVWERSNARYRTPTLDTAAWLTFLDAASIAALDAGAIDRIHVQVIRHPCAGGGVVLQAGPAPDPCDTNQRDTAYTLLKSVNDAIIPLRTTKWALKGWGSRKDPELENSWFRRMDA